jgi:4,4'-diaponeurosporenoate glycosyltransferase
MGPVTAALAVIGLLIGLALMWRLPTLPAAPVVGTSAVRIAVVVPARNEAARLPRLLASLAAQTRRADRILVVDDASTDATAEVARRGGAAVVTTDGPPPGWAGKTWACHVGTAAVDDGDVVVLLDADVFLAPDALGRLLAEHARVTPDGLLSVQPHHRTERAYEQLSAVANVVPIMAAGFAAVRPPRTQRVAFGPCLVTSAAALTAVGGFAAVRATSVEDIALAGRYADAGRSVRCFAGGDTVGFRMYGDGVGALVEGWTKNLAGGARRTPWWSTAGAVVWVAAALAVTVALVIERSALAAVAYAALGAELGWMLRRVGRFRWWTWVLHPAPTVAFVVLFVRSVVARGVRRSVVWRGRRVAVGG